VRAPRPILVDARVVVLAAFAAARPIDVAASPAYLRMSSSTPSGRPAPASDFPRVATPRARRPARARRVPVVLVPTRATAARASRASPRARDRSRRPAPRASGADETIRTVRIVPLRPSHRASSTCVVERARDDARHRAPSIHVDAPRARVDSRRGSSTTTTTLANAPRAFASTAIDRAREATSMGFRDGASRSVDVAGALCRFDES